LLDAEALIGRGRLTALLPRNSRGGRKRRKGREAATEAVAIVALAWMEKKKLKALGLGLGVLKARGWGSWQETGGVHFHCPVQ
jgi:hypothetical protein